MEVVDLARTSTTNAVYVVVLLALNNLSATISIILGSIYIDGFVNRRIIVMVKERQIYYEKGWKLLFYTL